MQKRPKYLKMTKAKGKTYVYYRTGVFGPNGKELLTPLPPLNDPGFWNSYASCMAGRTRRVNTAAELTVPALCDLYEASDKFRRLAPGSQRLYRFSLAYFKKMLPTAPAGLIERKHLAKLIDGRADQPGAANSLLRTINAVYKWARERGHVTNDPGKDIPELEGGEHEPWPQHVLDAALKADDARVRLATHLLLYTAQRIGDVVNMKWTDIATNAIGGSFIRVRQQKTKRLLVIPLHEALQAELARHERGLGYILPHAKQQALRIALQAFAAEHGAKVVPHGLRKNAVNALLEAGCSAAETGAISGQSMQIVEQYAARRSQPKLAGAAILRWNKQ